MANEKHLSLIKRGVEVWNKWRKKYPEVIPDLKGADLRKLDLSGADLRRANFDDADLSKSDLSNADLRGVDFRGANRNPGQVSSIRVHTSKVKLIDRCIDRFTSCRIECEHE
jgi:hypothetical protein